MAKNFFIKAILSIVLLSTLTLTYGQSIITASLSSPGNAGIISENCGGPYNLVIRRGPDNQESTIIFISDNGTATIGTDYSFPSDAFPVNMDPQDSIVTIPITVNNDGIPEGTETIIWELAFAAGLDDGYINLKTSIVDAYEVEIESPTDTIQWCRDVPYVLQASSLAEISWSPAAFFDDSVGTAATVRPFESGWYYAEVGSDTCGAKDSVYFELAIVEILGDTIFICAGEEGAILSGTIEGLATEFKWIPSDATLSDPSILNPVATPEVTTTYILQSDIGICTASDRVVVRVDSIPTDLHIDIAPLKPYYCAGEIVALYSPSYDSLDFPDITFNWLPVHVTFETPRHLLNAAVILQDTTLFIRENINNACVSADSLLVNVVPPTVPLSVTDTMLCPGEMFDVQVLTNQPITSPEWAPGTGLSCTKCTDMTVTVIGEPGTAIKYRFTGMINECPVSAHVSVIIPAKQEIQIAGDTVVCEGEIVPLTITNPKGLSNFNWTITFGDGNLSCIGCPDPSVTINSFDDGIVIIKVSADNFSGQFCGAEGIITLRRGMQPQLDNVTLDVCPGETVVASVESPLFTDVVWDVISGDISLSCTECPNPVVTANSAGRIGYFAEVSGPDTCRVRGILTVSLHLPQVNTIEVVPDPVAQGAEVTATLQVMPQPLTVKWTVNGAIIPATGPSITFNANEEVNFIIAEYINSDGCEQIDTVSFPTVPPSFLIPNAFTPNSDATNDVFRVIIMGDIELEEFLIFNRWGQLVFEASGDLAGWDGTWKDKPAASDTYVYTAKLRYPNGRTEIAKGDVALLR